MPCHGRLTSCNLHFRGYRPSDRLAQLTVWAVALWSCSLHLGEGVSFAKMLTGVRASCAAAVIIFSAVLLVRPTRALNFRIAPKEELCFHEITHKGNKVLAFFDVLSWGYGAYVYLYVTSPTGKELQKFEAASEGRIEFIATEDGEHAFCFKNAYTETEVSFWVNTETDVALADVAKEGPFFRNQVNSTCLLFWSISIL